MSVTMTTRYAGQAKGFCHWLKRVRVIYVVTGLCFMVIFIPFIIHGYISVLAAAEDEDFDSHRSRSKLDHPDELTSVKVSDLKFRIEELKRIKASVNNELRELESKRQKLHSEISGYNIHLEQLKKEYEQSHVELQQLTATIENRKEEIAELIQRTTPEITAPKRILPNVDEEVFIPPPKSSYACRMHTCFDYSRCSMTSQFPVYFYHPSDYLLSTAQLDGWVKEALLRIMKTNAYITPDPHVACLYVVLMGELDRVNASILEDRLHNLPFWRGDGRNHILLNLARSPANRDMFERVNIGRAMIAQSTFSSRQFRTGFDLILPPSLDGVDGDVWHTLSPISPARRLHLLSFQGEYLVSYDFQKSTPLSKLSTISKRDPSQFNDSDVNKLKFHSNGEQFVPRRNIERRKERVDKMGVDHLVQEDVWDDAENDLQADADDDVFYPHINHNQDVNMKVSNNNHRVLPGQTRDFDMNNFGRTLKFAKNVDGDAVISETPELVALERSIVDTLKRMQNLFQEGAFQFDFSCGGERTASLNAEWALCNPAQKRHELLRRSTFVLILAPTNYSIISSTVTQVRLYEAFNHGAIPVILGDYIELPFMESIQWRKAAIILPKARITEIHFYLQSVSDADILEMRRQGRHLWETHFGSMERIIDTLLASVRVRLNIPALAVRDTVSKSVFNATFQPLIEEVLDPPPDAEEVLGPMESPMPSFKFRRNFTSTMTYLSDYHDPFHLYPYTPFEPVLPAEAKFLGSSLGFRPIGKGAGGAGKEFHMALGGNHPREQFTIVMLTYERDVVLITALHRLKSLPHLNKVLVVWNNPQPPADDLKWPDIGVPIHVIRTAKNSLNNRFLPYDLIETEAILSMDDDAHLRHDEIIFGFRVWRESRERLVGFPGRFHAWDANGQTWQYNSNYSCELSMVLTGAAFFHKYYAYLYSYVMPQAIRDKVDEYINCEDLAMNFLVAHVTRTPPIKVTSRWTFRCAGCPQALSEDDSHFQERHKCLNFFTSIYGYMPLLSTQFRVDSVLFKTRIPHDKQKCFKFI